MILEIQFTDVVTKKNKAVNKSLIMVLYMISIEYLPGIIMDEIKS